MHCLLMIVGCVLVTLIDAQQPNDLQCVDKHASCDGWSKLNECKVNPAFMQLDCPQSCGLCNQQREFQRTPDNNGAPSAQSAAASSCLDSHRMCEFWAQLGECINNPAFMSGNCTRACLLCPDQIQPQLNINANNNAAAAGPVGPLGGPANAGPVGPQGGPANAGPVGPQGGPANAGPVGAPVGGQVLGGPVGGPVGGQQSPSGGLQAQPNFNAPLNDDTVKTVESGPTGQQQQQQQQQQANAAPTVQESNDEAPETAAAADE